VDSLRLHTFISDALLKPELTPTVIMFSRVNMFNPVLVCVQALSSGHEFTPPHTNGVIISSRVRLPCQILSIDILGAHLVKSKVDTIALRNITVLLSPTDATLDGGGRVMYPLGVKHRVLPQSANTYHPRAGVTFEQHEVMPIIVVKNIL
jgi:hypothetical protein